MRAKPGYATYDGWDEVAKEVVGHQATAASLPDLSEEAVDVAALHQHPAEGGEEEEVEHHGDGRAELGQTSGVEAGEEEEVGQEEAAAEVGVDGGPVTAHTWDAGEDPDAQHQEDHRDRGADHGEGGEPGVGGGGGEDVVDVHQDGEVGEVAALAGGPLLVRHHQPAPAGVPVPAVPEHALHLGQRNSVFSLVQI